MADWINNLIARCESEHVVLAGHSMGSLVAMEAAARSPQCVAHLALLGISVPMPVGDALLDAAKNNLPLARQMIATYAHAFDSQLGGNPISGISVMNMALALMAQAEPDVMHTDLSACNNYVQGLEAASKVSAKTTLIIGAEDMMASPRGLPDLQQAFADASVEMLQCGHMMMAERPEETLQALLRAWNK